jgi:hypothetical protein
MIRPSDRDLQLARRGRRAALILAGVALFWILATALGAEYGWPQGVRLALDLIALCGMAGALWMTWTVWRLRQSDKGPN